MGAGKGRGREKERGAGEATNQLVELVREPVDRAADHGGGQGQGWAAVPKGVPRECGPVWVEGGAVARAPPLGEVQVVVVAAEPSGPVAVLGPLHLEHTKGLRVEKGW